jgi:hypothetical protein
MWLAAGGPAFPIRRSAVILSFGLSFDSAPERMFWRVMGYRLTAD